MSFDPGLSASNPVLSLVPHGWLVKANFRGRLSVDEASVLGVGVWGQCVYEKSQNSKKLEMIKSQDVNSKSFHQED